MRSTSYISAAVAALGALAPVASADRMLQSTSLTPCQENSNFTATLFNVAFTPNNNTLTYNINAITTISAYVTAEIDIFAYGLSVYSHRYNPCDEKSWSGLCPMNNGPIDIKANTPISASDASKVPGIAYTFPDIDVKVQIRINRTDTGVQVACVEAELSNGKTVYQKSVGWVTGIIAGVGLLASAITSGLGHSNTAAHVAANALSLFGYFQAQAFIAMTAVPLPPIVSSWTQNFVWSLGIIRLGFLQDFATWYQRSTGGKPDTLLSSLDTTSVTVQKRSLEVLSRAYAALIKRVDSSNDDQGTTDQTLTVRGIERVGFRAGIEKTNIFFTGYTFFVIFVLLVVIAVLAFKFICEGLIKSGKMKSDKFLDFRNGWKTVLKGILYRVVLISFPQLVILCFWELTVRDSAAEVVLAVVTIIFEIVVLTWASFKVWRIAQRSIAMHKNPAYILYSDPVALNKWGFLYVQFKAAAYYFIVPILFYILVKGMFIGLSQSSGVVQAAALVVIEAALLIAVCVLRPYMDKKTNGFNISIAIVNFLCAIFLLMFSNVFDQPGIVTGVMGIVFFVFNAVFALILLLMVLVASFFALTSKNPDTRYQPMRDDRGSFIKSQTQLNVGAELDALGATARGDSKMGMRQWESPVGAGQKPRTTIDDDSSSFESEKPHGLMTQSHGGHGAHSPYRDSNYSSYSNNQPPMSSTSFIPAAGYNNTYGGGHSHSPARPIGGASANGGYRPPGASSPWQRGAGYE